MYKSQKEQKITTNPEKIQFFSEIIQIQKNDKEKFSKHQFFCIENYL